MGSGSIKLSLKSLKSVKMNCIYCVVKEFAVTCEIKDCIGTLSMTGINGVKSVDIKFEVNCSTTGIIDINLFPLQWKPEMLWLSDLMRESDFGPNLLILNGQNAEGFKLNSNHIYLLEATPQRNSEETTLPIKISCLELHYSICDIDRALHSKSTGIISYDLQGFQCIPCVSTIAPVGMIKAAGSAKIDDYDKISGRITVESTRIGRVNEWTKRSDEQVELIMDVFSLAGGRYVEWARRSVYLDDAWVETIFRSPAHRGKPSQPTFHYLNMQPILDLAVHKYNKATKETTGIGIALEQFLISSLYVESQYTTCFMALEHLVNTYAQQHKHDEIIPAKKFDKFVKPKIKAGLNSALDTLKTCNYIKESEVEVVYECMKDKIIELNRYSFSKKLERFLKGIKVPLVGLTDEEIKELVGTRNAIIHSGAIPLNSPYYSERQQRLALLRELITRIFLTLLGFEGEYSSYFHGQQYVHFPTMEKR